MSVDWQTGKITGGVVDRICYVHGWGSDILKRYRTNLIETADFVFCNKYEEIESWGQDEDYCIYNKRTGEEKRIKFESFEFGSNYRQLNYAVEPGENTIYYQRDGHLLAFNFATLEKPQKLFRIPGDHPEWTIFREALNKSTCAAWRADFSSGKPKSRRNTDVFQGFLAQSRQKRCRQDARGDLFSVSLIKVKKSYGWKTAA